MKNSQFFEKAFNIIIGIEGGYVNDPQDSGGETKYGISKRAYPHINIKDLTLDEAKKIYFGDYWNTRKLDLDDIEDESISIELFDISVNMGSETSRKFLQQSLNLLNKNEKLFDDLIVDGWCGIKTFRAYEKVNKKILLKVLNGLQFERYKLIVENNPYKEKFFVGWMRRV